MKKGCEEFIAYIVDAVKESKHLADIAVVCELGICSQMSCQDLDLKEKWSLLLL